MKTAVGEEALRGWVMDYPRMNGYTHFACILDPQTGEIRFRERGYEN